MSKELEEIKSIVAIHFGALGFLNPSENEQILKDRDKVLNALTELKSIKEANLSKALKCLIGLEKEIIQRDGRITDFLKIKFDIIKQALIKAQEQEKVLKIIFEKYVDLNLLDCDDEVEEYNRHFGKGRQLTEEEFELLKRWLG